jgi:hypothetical protein
MVAKSVTNSPRSPWPGGLSWAMRCVKPSCRVRLDRFSYAGIEVPRLMPVYPVAGVLRRLFDIFKVGDEALSLLAEGLAEAVNDLAVERPVSLLGFGSPLLSRPATFQVFPQPFPPVNTWCDKSS